jgi:hypothetical protein
MGKSNPMPAVKQNKNAVEYFIVLGSDSLNPILLIKNSHNFCK